MAEERSTQRNERAVRRVLIVTLALNLGVAIAKVVYGSLAHALAIRADGFHSLADGLNNVVALVALVLAIRPPDEDHPYGHRKHEIVAAGFIGVSLLVIAFDVLRESLARLAGTGTPPALDHVAFLVLGATAVVNVFVARYEAHAAKRYQSPLLSSDAQHTRADVVVTAGVLLSVLATRAGFAAADSIAAALVAAFVGWIGLRVLRENLGYLSDTALVDPARVVALVRAVPGVLDAHSVRSRGTPGEVFVDLHIHVARDLTLERAHEITHQAMAAVENGIPGVADVHIHTEPDGQHR